MKKKITGKETFSMLLDKYPDITDFLVEKGMFCIWCQKAAEESIIEGAKAHGINPRKLVKEINERLNKKAR
jgi:hybrid cluster-associated redox disulfide protein